MRPGKIARLPGKRVPLAAPLLETRLSGLAPHRQGKVRDIFDLGDSLLMVATDRISAFDYVLGSGIPDKGKVLTQLSAFWFEKTTGIVPNHLQTMDVREYPREMRPHADILAGRSMLVRKTNPVQDGRNTRQTARCAESRCPPDCVNPTLSPNQSSRPRPKRPRATTSISAKLKRPDWWVATSFSGCAI